MELKNKVIIITGGTKGLGKALTLSFLKENAKVVICAQNEEDIINTPKGVLGIRADVTKENDLKNVAEITIEKFKEIDIWINNAGIWLPHLPIEEVDWKRAHDLIEVNLFGTVYGSKIALAQMRKQNSGTIINIISTSGLEGKINETAYCASKFAVNGFTESLKKEVDGKKIKVISIYPGRMQTNLFDEKKPENYNEYMDPLSVAEKIIKNLKKKSPKDKLIIKRNN